MFRPNIGFDALLRITQMISLQFTFYFIYLFVVLLLDYFSGLSYSHDQILNFSLFDSSFALGRIAILGQFFGGLSSAILFSFLEGRSRNALDFISTTFAIHLVVVSILYYFPKSVIWWVSFLVSWGAATLLAERLSMKFELRDINLDVALPAVLERSRDPDGHL
jgi:hypothetical protein